jgi:phosphomannomutase
LYSGPRVGGEIGTDFTFNNVRIVTSAIIGMFKGNDRSVIRAMGVSGFDEIRARGVIVGHDNRFLGPDFAMEVIGLLQREGIRTWYAGEAPTPAFSAVIEILNAACAINLTPSHNPANYAASNSIPLTGACRNGDYHNNRRNCEPGDEEIPPTSFRKT